MSNFMTSLRGLLCILLCVLLYTPPASIAGEGLASRDSSPWDGERWQVSGFASLGLGRLRDPGLELLGYDDQQWRMDGDTVLGLQLNGDITDRLAFTAQVVSRGYSLNDTSPYEPELDWLFLSYQLDSRWRLRLGRMRTPHYLYSETLDVGYSYVWARPPIDVYANILSPFSYFNGVDVRYLMDFQALSMDLQLFSGYLKQSRDNLTIKVEPMVGGNITLQWEHWKLRYGLLYDRTDIVLDLNSEFDAALDLAIAMDPGFEPIRAGLKANDDWYRYQVLGLRWETDRVAVTAEMFDITNTDDGYQNHGKGCYASVQVPLGDFTPYVVRGAFLNEYNPQAQNVLTSSLQAVPLGQPGYEFFDVFRQQALGFINSFNYEQKTWTLGVRYELLPQVALKAEWQRFDFGPGNTGQMIQQTAAPPSHTALSTLIIDVVF